MQMSVDQVRVARPTNRLDEVIRFYCDGLGLQMLLSFEKDQAGYGGVVIGIPDSNCHLEFCTHEKGFSDDQVRPLTGDHLLVFYLSGKEYGDGVVKQLKKLGFFPVPAANPHWDCDGVTFEDPDGWRVVLMWKRNV